MKQDHLKVVAAAVAVTIIAALAWIYASESGAAVPTPDWSTLTADRGAPTGGTESGPESRDPPADPARRSLAAPDGAPFVRVHGRVLDPYGEPLGRAWVGDATSGRPVVTAEDGRFELLAEGGHPQIALLVLDARHAPFLSRHEIEHASRVCDAGDIQLLRGGGIQGRITDRTDGGVPRATATLLPASRNAWPPSLDLTELLKPAAADADGLYSFANLPPGRYRIEASAAGMQTVQSGTVNVGDGVVTTVEPLALGVGHDLVGLVLGPDGVPVPDAAVRIRSGRGQPRYDGRAETTADGRFRIDALPSGPLRIDVTCPGFLNHSASDVDPALGEELVIRLEGGLRVAGTVVDSRTGLPVERFATAIRRTGRLDPTSNGTMEQQLGRRIDSVRASAAGAVDPDVREEELRIATELESRMERVRQQEQSRPVVVPADVGQVAERPEGRFSFTVVEEGLYSVGIASPDHLFADVGPVEVRRGAPVADLRVELVPGHALSGVVVSKHDDEPIAGAQVELVQVLEASPEAMERSRVLYPWVFAHGGPRGVTVATARTSDDGSFEFRQAAAGRFLLSVRHPKFADHDTDAFYLQGGRQALRIAVGARASLSGRIAGIPAGQEGRIRVLVLGGYGTMRTVDVEVDGTYRFDGLQPGSYLVRAFPSDAERYVDRLLGSTFGPHAAAVDQEQVPAVDVTLAEGESRVFHPVLDVPPTGGVQGTVSINGAPAGSGRAILRPVPGEAPGSGGLSLRGDYEDLGRFTIGDVPPGEYTLVLYGPTRQELHQEPITVAPGATTAVAADLAAGGLRGRVTASDGAPAEELRGYLWVLPGAAEAPGDLYEYRRTERTHRISVRGGAFEDEGLTPGPAFLIVDIRGRERVETTAVIPVRETLELELTAGERVP